MHTWYWINRSLFLPLWYIFWMEMRVPFQLNRMKLANVAFQCITHVMSHHFFYLEAKPLRCRFQRLCPTQTLLSSNCNVMQRKQIDHSTYTHLSFATMQVYLRPLEMHFSLFHFQKMIAKADRTNVFYNKVLLFFYYVQVTVMILCFLHIFSSIYVCFCSFFLKKN